MGDRARLNHLLLRVIPPEKFYSPPSMRKILLLPGEMPSKNEMVLFILVDYKNEGKLLIDCFHTASLTLHHIKLNPLFQSAFVLLLSVRA